MGTHATIENQRRRVRIWFPLAFSNVAVAATSVAQGSASSALIPVKPDQRFRVLAPWVNVADHAFPPTQKLNLLGGVFGLTDSGGVYFWQFGIDARAQFLGVNVSNAPVKSPWFYPNDKVETAAPLSKGFFLNIFADVQNTDAAGHAFDGQGGAFVEFETLAGVVKM